MSKNILKQSIAEFIGTFFLVLFGCGAIILAEVNPDFDTLYIPFIFGATITVMIYAVGHISGAHFNPAVSIAFFISRSIGVKKLFSFVVAQIIGATLASLLHLFLFGNAHTFGSTVVESFWWGLVITELILSFCLMFVIKAVATDSRAVGELAGIAIGTTVFICACVGGSISGASMNPARTLGPSIISGNYGNIWIYILSPIIGAVLGALTYNFIKCDSEVDTDTQGCC